MGLGDRIVLTIALMGHPCLEMNIEHVSHHFCRPVRGIVHIAGDLPGVSRVIDFGYGSGWEVAMVTLVVRVGA